MSLSGISIGDIVDANGAAALDKDGQILTTAKSFWTSGNQDGGDVRKGRGWGSLDESVFFPEYLYLF